MRLRKPCEHGRYEPHSQLSEGGHPESSIAYFDCPGGEFLPEDALVIWWCEEHDPKETDSTSTACHLGLEQGDTKRCRMVEKYLVGEPG